MTDTRDRDLFQDFIQGHSSPTGQSAQADVMISNADKLRPILQGNIDNLAEKILIVENFLRRIRESIAVATEEKRLTHYRYNVHDGSSCDECIDGGTSHDIIGKDGKLRESLLVAFQAFDAEVCDGLFQNEMRDRPVFASIRDAEIAISGLTAPIYKQIKGIPPVLCKMKLPKAQYSRNFRKSHHFIKVRRELVQGLRKQTRHVSHEWLESIGIRPSVFEEMFDLKIRTDSEKRAANYVEVKLDAYRASANKHIESVEVLQGLVISQLDQLLQLRDTTLHGVEIRHHELVDESLVANAAFRRFINIVSGGGTE